MSRIGQAVTLKLPAERLREVNLTSEQNVRGAFETEFYRACDFRPVRQGAARAGNPPAACGYSVGASFQVSTCSRHWPSVPCFQTTR
jgi:hypothetical protein